MSSTLFLLQKLLDPKAEVRVQAEEEFKSLQLSRPDLICQSLLDESHHFQNQWQQTMAFILLRQTFKLKWMENLEGQKVSLASLLLSKIVSCSDQDVKQRMVEAFVALPQVILLQFTDAVIQIVQSNPQNLALIDGFSEFAFSPQVIAPFGQALSVISISPEMIKASVSLLCASGENGKTDLKVLGSALPNMILRFSLDMMQKSNEEDHEVDAIKAMESLCTLADLCPWTLESNLKEICSNLLDIGEASSISSDIRCLSISVFTSIATRKANSICKDKVFSTRVIRCMLKMQVEDDGLSGLFVEPEVDEGDVLQISQVGLRGTSLDCLNALVVGSSRIVFDSRLFFTACLSEIKPLLSSPEWTHKLAALSSLGVVCIPLQAKVLKPVLAELVQGCIHMMRSTAEHSKIRFASCAVIFNLLQQSDEDDWIPSQVKTMTASVLPALASCIQEEKVQLIWLMTLRAFMDKGEGSDDEEDNETEEEILVYFDELVSVLVRCMERHSQASVLALSMDCLSVLGQHYPRQFAKFYPVLVPGIKQNVLSRRTDGVAAAAMDSSVRKSAMLLVGSCAEAVGKQQFAQDAMEIVGWFLNSNQNGSSHFDQVNELEGLFIFCEQVSSVLQQDFAPFLVHLLPLVFQALQADLGIHYQESNKSESSSSFEQASGNAKVSMEIRGTGGVEISANIYNFQIRFQALKLVSALALNHCLTTHLTELLEVVLANASDRLCTAMLNCEAVDACCELFLLLCKQPQPSQDVNKAFVELGTQFLSGLSFNPTSVTSDELDRRSAFANGFERLCRICFLHHVSAVPLPLGPTIFNVLRDALCQSISRRRNIAKELESQEFDLDTLEQQVEAIAEEEVDVSIAIVDSWGYLLKQNPEQVFPTFQQVVLPLCQEFANSPDKHLQHHFLCVFVDALEHGPVFDLELVQILVPRIVTNLQQTESELLTQVAAYGMGVLAQKLTMEQGLDRWAEGFAQLLMWNLNQTQEEVEVRENVVSALGKLYVRFPSRVDWQLAFVKELPLTEDCAEAKIAHEVVLRLYLENKLVNPSQTDKVLVKICEVVVARALANDDAMLLLSNEQARELLPLVLRKLGEEKLGALLDSKVSLPVKEALLALLKQ